MGLFKSRKVIKQELEEKEIEQEINQELIDDQVYFELTGKHIREVENDKA